MEPDHPAAHSMDTYWFAIDKRGHVAAFETGECGYCPPDPNDLFEELHTLFLGPPDWEGWDPEEWARRMGFIFYSYVDDYEPLLRPYPRIVLPERPLHVDQLPPLLRSQCGEVRFWMLRFDEAELLQPFEHELDDLRSWDFYEAADHPAYLSADGVTVRAVPGEEKKFDDFVRDFCQEYAEEAAGLRFKEPKGRSE